MKKLFLALVLLSLSSPALAKSAIFVTCQCVSSLRGAPYYILITTVNSDPSEEEVASCKIEQGKIVSGCDMLIIKAQRDCRQWSATASITQPCSGVITHDN